ncbi:hypothetical protein AWB67_03511 [Caballeronia terrestris]|uniref:Uncharacterized protein n=1 Tax=Caballeronia terrestris TaxID=1226301 RepID=A0A158J8J4_9BURK|nr:hypothetical protein AWB67_03511 [Caballeronia terrestris]
MSADRSRCTSFPRLTLRCHERGGRRLGLRLRPCGTGRTGVARLPLRCRQRRRRLEWIGGGSVFRRRSRRNCRPRHARRPLRRARSRSRLERIRRGGALLTHLRGTTRACQRRRSRRRLINRSIERRRRGLGRRDAPNAIEPLCPIRIRQVIKPHGAACRRCINKPQLSHIYPDVRMRPTRRIEKNQITRRDFIRFDRFTAAAHISSRARQIHRSRPVDHIPHEPAAIETGVGRIAAPSIRHADERHCLDRNLFAPDAVIDEIGEIGWRRECATGGRCVPGRLARQLLRRAAASGEQQCHDQQ